MAETAEKIRRTGGYDHREIEPKWTARWAETGIHKTDLKGAANPYYNLMMFPYPSAEGLHVGNVYAFTSDGLTPRQLRDYVEDVRTQVLTVPNAGKVELIGAQDEAIFLEFSTRQIAGSASHPLRLRPSNICL